jgi:GNAT superfamily N-acetyltransferase
MELEDITIEEIKPFFNSLTVETETFTPEADLILSVAVFTKGVRIDGKLAGIGGLGKSFGYFLTAFMIVKSEHQGKGVGSTIYKTIINYARKKGHYFIFSQVAHGNTSAYIMNTKAGQRILYDDGTLYWMACPLNKVGEFLVRYILPIIFMAYLSPPGKPLRLLHQWETSLRILRMRHQ